MRTFRLVHGLGATLTQVFTRVRRGCVIQRCQNKTPERKMGPGGVNDVTRRKRGLRFEKKQLVEFPPGKKKVDFQSWARPDDFVCYGRCALVGLRANDVKSSQHRKIVSLSLLMSKNLLTQR